MQKVISVLGVVSAVTFAVAAQFNIINPRIGMWLVLFGTAASAATGALTKYGSTNIYVTVGGVVVAVASVVAGAADILPQHVTLIASIVGTAIAAAGKSLFGIEADKEVE